MKAHGGATMFRLRPLDHRLAEIDGIDAAAEAEQHPRDLAGAGGEFEHAVARSDRRMARDQPRPGVEFAARADLMAVGEIEGLGALRPIGTNLVLEAEIRTRLRGV